MTPEELAKAGTEHAHQCALFCWAALNTAQWPELALMFAIPNGGMRSKITAANLKAEGVKAGVLDIFLPVPRGRWHGLFIELKVGSNKPTVEQIKWIDALRAQGFGATWCVGWEVAREIIISYLGQNNA